MKGRRTKQAHSYIESVFHNRSMSQWRSQHKSKNPKHKTFHFVIILV